MADNDDEKGEKKQVQQKEIIAKRTKKKSSSSQRGRTWEIYLIEKECDRLLDGSAGGPVRWRRKEYRKGVADGWWWKKGKGKRGVRGANYLVVKLFSIIEKLANVDNTIILIW